MLSSSVVAGLVAGLVALRSSERKIQIENVTQERAKWRSKIRELMATAHKSACSRDTTRLGELVTEFEINLNPLDPEDIAIVSCAYDLSLASHNQLLLLELRKRVTLLLKHDWERAKHESKPWFFRFSPPSRVPYAEFNASIATGVPSRSSKNIQLTGYFLGLMYTGALLFVLSAFLHDPFVDLLKKLNDPKISKTATSIQVFFGFTFLIGAFWAAAYLGFKGFEKKFLEVYFSKSESKL